WVIVTSQENIDAITKVKGDDFSKIQGRFNARLSLSSSSVDEVINCRLLEKNDYARPLLGLCYQQNASSLRNLFTFSNGTRGDEEEFITCYPFAPYQYKLLQQTLTEVRKHGSSGKHLSDGARSMLSAFQEAALTVKDQEEGALVPFCRFYDTVVTFLEGRVSSVIDRAWRAAVDHNGLEQEDLDVLKLLFLLKDVQDMPSNLENLAVLMIDHLNADKVAMRHRIAASLDRLVAQNYVARMGDIYRFLNDDEQDINRAIREMSIDPSDVLREIGGVIFGDMLSNYRKVRYQDRNDYTLDQYIDESALTGVAGNIRLRFITSESDYADAVDEQTLLLRSRQNEVIVLLSRDYDYASELRDKLRINKYVKQKVLSQLPEAIREIVAKKQRDANEHESRAKGLITDAILHGTFFVFGDRQSPVGSSVKEKVDDAMSRLIEAVYNKLLLITKPVKSDAEVSHILSTPVSQDTLLGAEYANRDALEDMSTYLEIQKAKNTTATVAVLMKRYQEPPYGWTQTDIAGLIAALLSGHRVQMLFGGLVLTMSDQSRILNCLLKKTEFDKAVVKIRPHVGHETLMNARAAAREI
ncbi:MAG: BREX system P-loop protein BrxC, partial [Clostridia bacterium]